MRFKNAFAAAVAVSAVVFSAAFQPAEAATTTYTGPFAVGTGTTISAGDTALLNNGATVTGTGVITTNGTFQVDQTATTLTFGNTISGTGTFSVTNTGTVNLTGTPRTLDLTTSVSAGRLTIGNASGNGALRIGDTGKGTLNVSGGLVSNATGTLGNSVSGFGSATVSSGTWASDNDLTVGSSGTGSLTVNGGRVSNFTATLGSAAGSFGSATVSSGTWASSNSLYVGASGTGSLIVNGSGYVSAGSVYVGNGSTGTGSVTVTSGSFAAGSVNVGYNGGRGAVLVNGGYLAASVQLGGGPGDNSIGSFTMESGTLNGYVNQYFSGSSAFAMSGGYIAGNVELLANSTGTITGGTLSGGISSLGPFSMNGGSLLGDLSVPGGTFTVSSGTVVSTAPFLFGSGTLNLNGGSITSAGAYPANIGSSGDLNINAGATWNVTNLGDTAPAIGYLTIFANNGAMVLSGSLDTTNFGNTGWINQNISGTGSITKQGTGGYVVSGTNAYTGPTNIEAGKFYVQAQLGNTAVTVSAGAFLGGGSGTTTNVGVTPGTILGSVAVASSGTISPGVFDDPIYGHSYFIGPIAALTVGSLSLSNGSHTVLDITGTMPFAAEYDQLVGTGAGGLTYGGSLDLLLTGSYATGTTWNLFSNFLTKNGDFADVNLNATGEYAGLTFTSFGGVWTSTKTANNQYLEVTPSTGNLVVVPEPSTIAMTLAGLACGGWQMVRRRRQLRQAASLSA
jgi:T5SS/PEP-CTERM-associated repeat protein